MIRRGVAVLGLLAVAAGPAAAQLASAPWPMFQHDALHTGRSGVAGPSSSAVKVKWTYKGRNWIKVQVAVGGDGTVYIGDSTYPLCALDPNRAQTDRPRWCTNDGGFVNFSSPALGNPSAGGIDTVYIGERNNTFWAFSAATGADLWRYKIPLDGDVTGSPLIAADGTVYMSCGCSIAGQELEAFVGRLYAFERAPAVAPSGAAAYKWVVDLPYLRNSSPAGRVVQFPAGSPPAPVTRLRLYVGTTDGRLVAIDDFGPGAGQVAWTLQLAPGAVNHQSSPSIGPDGTVYVGTSAGLFAVRDDGDAGAVLPGWPFTDGGTPGVFDTSAAISDATVFVSRYYRSRRTLYAVAAAHSTTAAPGTRLWSKGPGAGGTSTNLAQTPSAVVGANGIVYAAIGKQVYAFDPAAASPAVPRWQFKLGADAISLSVGDGVLYVAAKDSKLYALIDQ